MKRIAGRIATGLLAAVAFTACGSGGPGGAPPPIPPLAADDSKAGAELSYPQPTRVEYRVEGTLPALAAHAVAYRLAAATSETRVARLAQGFGVSGAVSTDQSGWTATGANQTLHVQRAGGLPWVLGGAGGSSIGASGCAVAGPGATTGTSVGSAPGSTPSSPGSPPSSTRPAAPPPTCPPTTTAVGLPSKTDAERLARGALTRAGFDLAGAFVETSGGSNQWNVSIRPAVGQVPVVGTAWSVTVGPNSAFLSASGYLADPVATGEYPLVGVPTGLQRLQQGPPWIIRGGPGPLPMMGATSGGTTGAPAPSPSPPPPATDACPAGATCAPGSPPVTSPCPAGAPCPTVPEPAPTIVTVIGVHLGLAWGFPGDTKIAEAWLVPVYVFELGGGRTIAVLAVSDHYLAPPSPLATTTVSPPEPVPKPAPRPARPTTSS